MSKNTIAHSNNCNLVELETERKVQFSHLLEFLNVDIDMYYLQGESKKTGISKFSNCYNSLIFEAKIHCNTIKPNVPKWRKNMHRIKI